LSIHSEGHVYDQDGLRSFHNHEFMDDPAFQAAYARGVQAAGMDYGWPWRVHVGLWAARSAAKLPGDFVECGVGHGFMSSAIMEDLGWDSTGRTFYLLDTFSGVDERYVTPEELAHGAMAKNQHMIDIGIYATDPGPALRNFAQWSHVKIIVGAVPETLDQIRSKAIAFLHIDMNCSPPEVAAITHLWSRLSPGCWTTTPMLATAHKRSQWTPSPPPRGCRSSPSPRDRACWSSPRRCDRRSGGLWPPSGWEPERDGLRGLRRRGVR
jgi:hypothetical protein